jgi:hypothetical protein
MQCMTAKEIRWNVEKDLLLRSDPARGGIGLAECAVAIEEGRVLADLPNPVRAGQRILVLEIDDYAYVVPYVTDGHVIFLKTMFPSRKHTAQYLAKYLE